MCLCRSSSACAFRSRSFLQHRSLHLYFYVRIDFPLHISWPVHHLQFFSPFVVLLGAFLTSLLLSAGSFVSPVLSLPLPLCCTRIGTMPAFEAFWSATCRDFDSGDDANVQRLLERLHENETTGRGNEKGRSDRAPWQVVHEWWRQGGQEGGRHETRGKRVVQTSAGQAEEGDEEVEGEGEGEVMPVEDVPKKRRARTQRDA